jgi:methyltransferase (TIGR00027 family)
MPSVTAEIVALARALGFVLSADVDRRTTVDRALAPGYLQPGLAWLRRRRGTVPRVAVRSVSGGLVDHLALRTQAIDDALAAAVDQGVSQLVILGAGLDARAHRLRALGHVQVFEVDHPASQVVKERRASALPRVARALTYVPVDFAKDDLRAALAHAGHVATRSTVWVSEGVTMYLPQVATVGTLGALRERSAEGSVLVMTYMETPSRPIPPAARAMLDRALSRMGEPLGATYTQAQIASIVRDHGFALRSDTCNVQWAATGHGGASWARPFRAERLIVAVRPSDGSHPEHPEPALRAF